MRGYAGTASGPGRLNADAQIQTVQTPRSGVPIGVRTGDSRRSMALNPNAHGAFRPYGERGVCFRPLTPPCPVSDYSDHSDGFFLRNPG